MRDAASLRKVSAPPQQCAVSAPGAAPSQVGPSLARPGLAGRRAVNAYPPPAARLRTSSGGHLRENERGENTDAAGAGVEPRSHSVTTSPAR